MKVICISGKAGSGKDTLALMIKDKLEQGGNTVLITHFADLLKYACKTYFGWNGEKDPVGRGILQYVGTDIIREQDPDYWCRFVSEMLEYSKDRWDYVLIPDARFPNEIMMMRDKFGARTIRIRRGGDAGSVLTGEQKSHISETAADDLVADINIENDGTLSQLEKKAGVITACLRGGTL